MCISRQLHSFSVSDSPVITGAGIAQLVERLTENSGAVLMWVRDFLSQSQLSVQTLLWCPYIPHVQMNASTSVCMLKIPTTGSRTIVWTQKTLHTLVGRGSAAPVAAVPYPGKTTQIRRKNRRRRKKQLSESDHLLA